MTANPFAIIADYEEDFPCEESEDELQDDFFESDQIEAQKFLTERLSDEEAQDERKTLKRYYRKVNTQNKKQREL